MATTEIELLDLGFRYKYGVDECMKGWTVCELVKQVLRGHSLVLDRLSMDRLAMILPLYMCTRIMSFKLR